MKLNQFFSHWDQVHKGTLDIFDRFSQDELTYVPYQGGWSVGQIALHIADAEDGWFGTIVKKEYHHWPADHTLEDYPIKKDIKRLLVETHARTIAYLKPLTMDDLERVVDSEWGSFSIGFIIWHVMEHEIHHRGELSLILGILGRKGWGS